MPRVRVRELIYYSYSTTSDNPPRVKCPSSFVCPPPPATILMALQLTTVSHTKLQFPFLWCVVTPRMKPPKIAMSARPQFLGAMLSAAQQWFFKACHHPTHSLRHQRSKDPPPLLFTPRISL
ncbi:hypothetical protein CEXT_372871 [Caerostris extrusa]|uniref:Uncharacterized protein n=1 Tax=Caerostris extrusa TaxID=172846 RepID=A0AAV4NDV5_CAEEX|nr:hypothetical protein CEXT_372871 [Caerostris extrusa]